MSVSENSMRRVDVCSQVIARLMASDFSEGKPHWSAAEAITIAVV